MRLLRSGGRSPRQLAGELGCSEQTLRNWLRQHEADRGERSEVRSSEERVRLRELERENRVLRQEREILKRAAVGSTGHRNARSSIAAGVWYPSVLRGRVFSRSAIWSRSC